MKFVPILIIMISIIQNSGIKTQFEELQKKYKDYLTVDPDLIYDLLARQREHPLNTPMYMLEVFTKRGTDPQMTRENILKKTGMVPAIYDNGTHYVTNQKLTMDMLKEISDSNDVLELVENILLVLEVWVLHMNKDTTSTTMITISHPQGSRDMIRNNMAK